MKKSNLTHSIAKRIMVITAVAILACTSFAGCGAKGASSDAAAASYQTYEFETFDGETVIIDAGNIISQVANDNPLDWADLPADAEQVAPGRDLILFADDSNYYVEDAENGLVTTVKR